MKPSNHPRDLHVNAAPDRYVIKIFHGHRLHEYPTGPRAAVALEFWRRLKKEGHRAIVYAVRGDVYAVATEDDLQSEVNSGKGK